MVDKSVTTKLPPKEIIYFDIETTIKEMTTRVLSDYLERAKRNEDKCQEIKEQNAQITRRFNELDFILHKTLQRSGNISDLQQEMLEVKQLFSVMEAKVHQQTSDMRATLQIQSEKQNIVEEQVFQYEKQFNRFQEYTQDILKRYQSLKNEVEEKINDNRRNHSEEILKIEHLVLKQNQQFSEFKGKLESHKDEINRHEGILEIFKRNIKELYESEMSLIDKKLDVDQFTNSFDFFKKDLQYLRISIDDATMTLQQTDNYLEKYLPIKIQNFITETLTNILPRRALQKLNDFIHHKYRVLKDVIEEDKGLPNLNKIEYSIPIIKKIELMMQKNLTNQMLSNNLMHQNSRSELYNQDGQGSIESFFNDESEKVGSKKAMNGFSQFNRLDTKQQELFLDNQDQNQNHLYADDSKSVSNLSGIHRKQQDGGSSEHGTLHGLDSMAVKKKSYMIYYPEMTEEQHQDVINIRADPKTNLVPVSGNNKSRMSYQQEEEDNNVSLDSQQRMFENNLKKVNQSEIDSPPPRLKLTQENLKVLSKEPEVQKQPDSQQQSSLSLQVIQTLGVKKGGPKSNVSARRYTEQTKPIVSILSNPSGLQHSITRKVSPPKKQVKIMKVEIEEDNQSNYSPHRKMSKISNQPISIQDGSSKSLKGRIKKSSNNIYEQEIDEDENEFFEDEEDREYEKNKLSVSSSSSDKRMIKLSDLNSDLGEMILEAFESSKSMKECGVIGLEKVEQAQAEMSKIIQSLTDENRTLISKEIAKVQVLQSNFIKDSEDDLRRRIREKTDLDLTIKAIQEKIEKSRYSFKVLKTFIKSQANMILGIQESVQILIKLGLQDEQDRKSISLYGFKMNESEKSLINEKPIVTLDKQCLSCSGQSSIVINAFKMACLSYQPQPITYQNVTSSRESLFTQTQGILEKAMRNFKNQNPQFKVKSSLINQFSNLNEDDLLRTNTNQTQGTLTSLDDYLMKENDSQEKQRSYVNINNFDIKAKVVNIDSLLKQQNDQNRAKTTSRAGSRNLKLSNFQSYKNETMTLESKLAQLNQISQRPQTTAMQNSIQNTYTGLDLLNKERRRNIPQTFGTTISMKSNTTDQTGQGITPTANQLIPNYQLGFKTARPQTQISQFHESYNTYKNENKQQSLNEQKTEKQNNPQSQLLNQIIKDRMGGISMKIPQGKLFKKQNSSSQKSLMNPIIQQMKILSPSDLLGLDSQRKHDHYDKKIIEIPAIKMHQTARHLSNITLYNSPKQEEIETAGQSQNQTIIRDYQLDAKLDQNLDVQKKIKKTTILKKIK
eukprot:403358851